VLCHTLGVKPLLIELPQGVTKSQPMTASYHQGTLTQVRSEVETLAQKLLEANLSVIRIKIEAMVTNKNIPQEDSEALLLPESNYFEFHVKVTLPEGKEEILRNYCQQHQAHLSKNVLKGQQQRFITMRMYGVGLKNAQPKFKGLLTGLKTQGYPLSNIQQEYAVYDSHVGLDAGWIL